MTLVAKPVIDKQFWILQENNQKIGNVEACAGGYQVKIKNQTAQFKTIRMVEKLVDVKFELPEKKSLDKSTANAVHGYTTKSKAHNPLWDVKMKLPVYTKTAKSKSWYAAGWYRVKKGRNWSMVQDPKLIVLQRYAFQGPFHKQEHDNDHTHTEIY